MWGRLRSRAFFGPKKIEIAWEEVRKFLKGFTHICKTPYRFPYRSSLCKQSSNEGANAWRLCKWHSVYLLVLLYAAVVRSWLVRSGLPSRIPETMGNKSEKCTTTEQWEGIIHLYKLEFHQMNSPLWKSFYPPTTSSKPTKKTIEIQPLWRPTNTNNHSNEWNRLCCFMFAIFERLFGRLFVFFSLLFWVWHDPFFGWTPRFPFCVDGLPMGMWARRMVL